MFKNNGYTFSKIKKRASFYFWCMCKFNKLLYLEFKVSKIRIKIDGCTRMDLVYIPLWFLKKMYPKICMYFVGVTSSLNYALNLVGELGSKNVY